MHEGLDIAGLGEEKVKKNGTRESTVLELFLPAIVDMKQFLILGISLGSNWMLLIKYGYRYGRDRGALLCFGWTHFRGIYIFGNILDLLCSTNAMGALENTIRMYKFSVR